MLKDLFSCILLSVVYEDHRNGVVKIFICFKSISERRFHTGFTKRLASYNRQVILKVFFLF